MSAVYSRNFLLLLPSGVTTASDSDTGSGADTATVAVKISPFPTNATVLDNANRANEGPPPTGWTDSVGAAALKVISNQFGLTTTAEGAAYFNTSQPADLEAYVELPTLGGATTQVRLYARQDPTTGGAGGSAYRVSHRVGGNTALVRSDANVITTLFQSADYVLANGDAIGIRCVGSVIEGWVRISGVWKMFGSVIDTTYSGASPFNKVALYIDNNTIDTNARVDNLTGGAVNFISGAAPGTDTGVGTDTATVSVKISPFPTTGILDYANRANEGPPPTGWTSSTVSVESNRFRPTSTVSGGADWNTPLGAADQEAYVEIPVLGVATSVTNATIRLDDAAPVDDYHVGHTVGTPDQIRIRRKDNDSSTTIGGPYNQDLADGDAIGIRAVGSRIEAWARISGEWKLLGSVQDATYAGSSPNNKLNLSYTANGSTQQRWDNFGGGVVSLINGAVPATDSGTGTDTAFVVVPISGTDTGAGADASTLAVALTATEASTGADASVISAVLSSSETGTGTDAGSVISANQVSGSDSGTGSDTATITFSTTVADTGAGSELGTLSLVVVDSVTSSEIPLISFIFTDSGTGTENATATFLGVDSGTGTDTATVSASYALTDSITSADASTLKAVLSGSETGTGSDTSQATVPVSVADSGSGVDAGILVYAVTVTDSLSGADASVLAAAFAVNDASTGSEISIKGMAVTDTGTGTETAEPKFSTTVTDSGTGTENAILGAGNSFTVSDSGAGADAVSAFTRPVIESGSETDSAAISLVTTDSGVGTDAYLLNLAVSDTGTGSDAGPIEKDVSDTGTGSDAGSFRITVSETGTGVEASTLVVTFTVTESAFFDDLGSLSALNFKTGSDSGDGTDVLSSFARTISDSASGADTGFNVFLVSDSATGVDAALVNYIVSDFGTGSDNGVFGTPLIVGDSGIGIDRAYNTGKAGTGTRKAILIDAAPGTSGRGSRLVTTKQRSKITA